MSKHKNTIVEVFEDNFVAEIKRMSLLLDKYNFVSMDTEFPGTVYQPTQYTKDFYYKSIKMNVDNLKLIQVGITLSDERGKYPPGNSTWQFNLKFDLSKDKYSYESIALLNSSGIDFEMLIEKGIAFEDFAEYLITSGLILSEEIHWVSFHGAYDFAYLLKLIVNSTLPETESGFLEDLELYFKNFYDIRILLKTTDSFKGGLNKIAQELDVVRIGSTHQAGSDSIVTAEVFFQLFKRSHLTPETLQQSKNVLFGLGDGADDETLSYTFFNNVTNMSNNIGVNPLSNITPSNYPNYTNFTPVHPSYTQKLPYNNFQQYPNNQQKPQTPLNVIYPLNMNNNMKPSIYTPYGLPQMQMYTMNNSNMKPINHSSGNVNVLTSGNYNNNLNGLSGHGSNSLNNLGGLNNISMNILNKEKKKNFGKTPLEAYSN